MENILNNEDFSNIPLAKNGVPKKLNNLVTLTFIGCGLMALFALISPITSPFSLKMMDKIISGSGAAEMSPEKLAKIDEARNLIELSIANMYPILIITLIGVALRIWGAVQMQKLKKDGFWVYVTGHIVPFVGTLVVMGMPIIKSINSYWGLILSGLFIYLYSKERYLLK